MVAICETKQRKGRKRGKKNQIKNKKNEIYKDRETLDLSQLW
jgi:hypothetical protein